MNLENFEYIIDINISPKICFGSGKKRDTFIAQCGQTGSGVDPGQYDVDFQTSFVTQILNKVRSNKGIIGTEERFKDDLNDDPGPGDYETNLSTLVLEKQQKVPFGSNQKIRQYDINDFPGAAHYYPPPKDRKCKRYPIQYNFGRPVVQEAITTKCVSVENDICCKCGIICKNDFWLKTDVYFYCKNSEKHCKDPYRKITRTYLCHLCWMEEFAMHETYNRKKLKKFQKIRNCFYMHDHQGTTAAIRIMSTSDIKLKRRIENYLSQYIDGCGRRQVTDIDDILALPKLGKIRMIKPTCIIYNLKPQRPLDY